MVRRSAPLSSKWVAYECRARFATEAEECVPSIGVASELLVGFHPNLPRHARPIPYRLPVIALGNHARTPIAEFREDHCRLIAGGGDCSL